jgi:photosystem II stability/assembly factor-like uncharacterized protein
MVNTGVIVPGGVLDLEVESPQSYSLESLETNYPCWVRLYGSSYGRSIDTREEPGSPFPVQGAGFFAEMVSTSSDNFSTHFSPLSEVSVENTKTLLRVRNDDALPRNILIKITLVISSYQVIPSSPPYNCNTSVDTQGQIDLSQAWRNCSTLTHLPLFNLSETTNLSGAWENCTALQFVPPALFDNCPASDLSDAFVNCSLTTASVDNILISLDIASVENGIVDITGGNNKHPSPLGLLSKANLESKGWTVNTVEVPSVSFVELGEEAYALSSFEDGRVVAGGYYGKVYISTDYGKTFDSGTQVGGDTIYAIAACGGDTIIVGTWYDSFYFISTDGGLTWSPGEDFNQSEIDSVAYAGDNVVYIGTYNFIHKSEDNGQTWLPGIEPNPEGDYYTSITFPGPNKVLAGGYSSGYLTYSFNGGGDWDSTAVGALGSLESLTQVTSNSKGVCIAGTDGAGLVFRSVDAGVTWDEGTQLGSSTQILSVTCSSSGIFFAGTSEDGKIYKSEDSGLTWEEFFNPGILSASVFSLTTSGNDTLIAGINTAIYSIPYEGSPEYLSLGQFYPTNSVEEEKIVKSNTAGILGSSPVKNVVSLTQVAYDELATKDPDTLYIIPY